VNRERSTRHLEAAESAGSLLAELGVDQTRRVDVFGLCEQVGLWLAFFPLDGLLGSYLPEGSGGVLITTQRPVSIQRYTAAHELGHWRLHHGRAPLFVSEDQVLGDTSDESEQLAQVFAAALLMPPPLVYNTLQLMGAHDEMSGVHAYAVARVAGVSYEAAVRQLANLEVINPARANELLKIKPLKIKTQVGHGRRPVIGTADVWPVDERWHGQQLQIHADDEIVISLPENRSTGYRWFLESHTPPRQPTPEPPALQLPEPVGQLALVNQRENLVNRLSKMSGAIRNPVPRSAVDHARATKSAPSELLKEVYESMELVGDRYLTARAPTMSARSARRARLERIGAGATDADLSSETSDSFPVIGGTGQRVLNVRFPKAGSAALRLKYQSAYSDNSEDIESYDLDVIVEPRRHGMSIEQLRTASESDWAQTVRSRQSAFSETVREQSPTLER